MSIFSIDKHHSLIKPNQLVINKNHISFIVMIINNILSNSGNRNLHLRTSSFYDPHNDDLYIIFQFYM